MAGSYESRQQPLLFARHSCPCYEQSGTPSPYRLSQDCLWFAVVSWSANRIAHLTRLLNLERTGEHANDQAHSPGGYRVMASRTGCKAQGCPCRQKGYRKVSHRTLLLLQTFGCNHVQESSRGFVSRSLPGYSWETYLTWPRVASESSRR